MLKFRKLSLSLLAVLGLSFAVACDKDEPTPEPQPEAPVISFNMTEVNATKDGGAFSVEFSIANPVEGVTASVAAPQVDWITGVDTSIAGIIKFNVEENATVEAREATFTVSYEGAADASFAVKQEAGDPVPFVFENLEVDLTSYTVDVIPNDKETNYIYFSSSKQYIEEGGFEDDDALFEDDIEYFQYLADIYGMTLVDVLSQLVYKGDQALGGTGMSVNTEYVGYAYHIDVENQTRLSDIVRLDVKTAALELADIEFEFDFEINGPLVDFTIKPQGYDGMYYWDAVDAEAYNAQYPDTPFEDWAIENWLGIVDLYLAYGFSVADLLTMCAQGEETIHINQLYGETEYIFYVFAVDADSAYPTSNPVSEHQTTGAVQPSDLVVDITIKDVTSRSVVVDYVASNEDPYVATVIEKEEFESLGSTDDDRVAYLIEYYWITAVMGSQFDSEFVNLSASTDHLAIAFGFMGGEQNTSLFKAEFTTEEAVLGDAVMTVSASDFYDSQEVAELDATFASYASPDLVLVPVDITIEPDSDTYYYAIYEDDGEEYSDEEWISYVTYNGPKTTKQQAYVLDYELPLIFVGVAVDANGNYGPVCKQQLYYARGEQGDAQDFLDWFYSDSAPRRQVCEMQIEKVKFEHLVKSDTRIEYKKESTKDLSKVSVREIETPELTKFQQKTR